MIFPDIDDVVSAVIVLKFGAITTLGPAYAGHRGLKIMAAGCQI